jgi:hypothetical protein
VFDSRGGGAGNFSVVIMNQPHSLAPQLIFPCNTAGLTALRSLLRLQKSARSKATAGVSLLRERERENKLSFMALKEKT